MTRLPNVSSSPWAREAAERRDADHRLSVESGYRALHGTVDLRAPLDDGMDPGRFGDAARFVKREARRVLLLTQVHDGLWLWTCPRCDDTGRAGSEADALDAAGVAGHDFDEVVVL